VLLLNNGTVVSPPDRRTRVTVSRACAAPRIGAN